MRIAFYGHFGAGNLGNECTLQTVIEHTRERVPDAQLQCICTAPQDVETRHRIAAFPAAARTLEWSWADLKEQTTDVVTGRSAVSGERGLLIRLVRIAFRRVPLELFHWIRTWRVIRGSQLLIVAGTGIVTDDQCGPLGWPYDMFKLCVLAALCRLKIVFLSVGVGPIHHPASRWLMRRSLALAYYRSYRDEASRRYAQDIGVDTHRDAVYPDLVFSLSRRYLTVGDGPAAGRRIIGLGLKDYPAAPEQAVALSYGDYLNTMADFVAWLWAHEYGVRILIGDAQFDTQVTRDLIAVLRARGAPADHSLVRCEPILSVEELLRQLAETDAVISPRFHNLVLALMLNKPVIALANLPKVEDLMDDLGMLQYCISLDSLDSATLTKRFVELERDAKQLRSHIAKRVESYRETVDEQYASLFSQAEHRRKDSRVVIRESRAP